jgi:hypothetical protein
LGAYENVFEPRGAHSETTRQRGGVEAVRALPVRGDVAGRSREGDETAGGRVLELREPDFGLADAFGNVGEAAAGVEHHDSQTAFLRGLGQRLAHVPQSLVGRGALTQDVEVGRDEVVSPAELQPVAGVEKERDAVRRELPLEARERLRHLRAREV